jgi:hypothetical protein
MLVANGRVHCANVPPIPKRVVVPKDSLSVGASRSSRMQYTQYTPKQHPFWPVGVKPPANKKPARAAAAPAPLSSPIFARSHPFTATATATAATAPHMRAYVASLRAPTGKPAPKDITSEEGKWFENQRKTALKLRYVAIAETRERASASRVDRIECAATLQASLKQEKNDIVNALETTYKQVLDRMNAYPAMSPPGRDRLMRTKDRLVTMRKQYLAFGANPKATQLIKNCWSKAVDLNKFACNQLAALKHDRAVPDKLTPRLVAVAKTKPDAVKSKTSPDSGLDGSDSPSPVVVAIATNTKTFSGRVLESIPESLHETPHEAFGSVFLHATEATLRYGNDHTIVDIPESTAELRFMWDSEATRV